MQDSQSIAMGTSYHVDGFKSVMVGPGETITYTAPILIEPMGALVVLVTFKNIDGVMSFEGTAKLRTLDCVPCEYLDEALESLESVYPDWRNRCR